MAEKAALERRAIRVFTAVSKSGKKQPQYVLFHLGSFCSIFSN